MSRERRGVGARRRRCGRIRRVRDRPALCSGVRRSCRMRSRFVPWGHGFGRWLADLTRRRQSRQKAALLAQSVRRYKAERPMDPVYLVAKSGGSGVVVKALELIDEQQVERAILLAPALSPAVRPLVRSRAVRREMVVFWSPLDVFMLGMGTKVFGTVDRVQDRRGGVGRAFECQPRERRRTKTKAREYDKLRQIRWRPRMAATRLSRADISGRIVPYFCGNTWCRCFGLKRLPRC